MANTEENVPITVAPHGPETPATSSPQRAPDPCVLIIFGASGDLTSRKLLPALYNLQRDGLLPEQFATLGYARRAKGDDPEQANAAFRKEMHDGVSKYSRTKPLDEDVWKKFAQRLEYHKGDYDTPEHFAELKQRLDALDKKWHTRGNRLFYMATPPDAFPIILDQLKAAGLIYPTDTGNPDAPWSRVIIEKPFGRDLTSARELNRLVGQTLDESQIFRIDHYLGKETVQNILVFRFGNAIFEPLWNRKYIDHVQITAAEQIGVEGRGKFYDDTGIMRDFVQNHILEVLALIAMEPPVSFEADEIRDEKAQVLRSLRHITGSDVEENVVHGQYEGYLKEDGVRTDSRTPTYAALKVHIDNWRWQGVPFYLRAGKALAGRTTEVAIQFQRIPLCLFGQEELCQRLEPNVLTLRIQPDEGIGLRFESKVPGDNVETASVNMDFSYARAFSKASADAYERLLLAATRGDATLFLRRDAVEWAWRFVTPMLERWEKDSREPIATYAKGSPGPKEADELLLRDGRRWRPL